MTSIFKLYYHIATLAHWHIVLTAKRAKKAQSAQSKMTSIFKLYYHIAILAHYFNRKARKEGAERAK
jgi:hypothetical protein